MKFEYLHNADIANVPKKISFILYDLHSIRTSKTNQNPSIIIDTIT